MSKTIGKMAGPLVALAVFMAVPVFGGTIAMYEFKERRVGQSAVGVPIVNSVGPSHVGTATATETGSLVYSSDAPGKFIVSSSGIVIKKPQSLLFGGSGTSVAGTGANVAFDAINNILSGNSATNYTVEFFMKQSAAKYSNNAIVGYDDGWYKKDSGHLNYEGISGTAMNIWAMNDTGKKYRFGPNYTNPFIFEKTFTSSLYDQWHHVAIVMSNKKLYVYLDYASVVKDNSDAVSHDMTYYTPTSGPLNLGMNNFRGNICGLRISDRALSKSSFLRVSDSYPNGDTLAHLSFDSSTPDNALSGDMESCALLNVGAPDLVVKGVAEKGPDGVYPMASKEPRRLLTTEDGEVATTNRCSMRLSVCSLDYATSNHLTGPFLTVPVYGNLLGNYDGDVTLEAFFKYDETGIVSTLDKLGNSARYRMTLMGLGNGNTNAKVAYVWLLLYDLKSKKLILYLDGREIGTGTTVYKSSGYSEACDLNGRWHHIAVKFDKTAQMFRVYLDYEQVLEFDVAAANLKVADPSVRGLYYFLGSTPNSIPGTAFNGWVDDFRITAGLLPVSRFLKWKMPGAGGCRIIVR